MSRTACSGSAVESTSMALSPPVSAISGAVGSRWSAMLRRMACAVSVEPVKATPCTRGSRVRAAPTAPSPGRSCSAVAGTPAASRWSTAMAAISGVCSAGFGKDGVSGGKGRSDLAAEDGQREVPRADAGEGAPRRVRQCGRASRVVAQEIHRLAQFGNGIGKGLARLARQKREDAPGIGLHPVGGAVQDRRALRGSRGPGFGQAQRGVHVRQSGG